MTIINLNHALTRASQNSEMPSFLSRCVWFLPIGRFPGRNRIERRPDLRRKKMPFGLLNATATHERLMAQALTRGTKKYGNLVMCYEEDDVVTAN